MNSTNESPSLATANPGRRLTVRIFVGMGLGVLLGGSINLLGLLPATEALSAWLVDYGANGILYIMGQAFVRLLQVIVIPLVVVSLTCGTASLDSIRQLGRIGAKTLGLYLLTTAGAITLALLAALIFKPGQGLSLSSDASFDTRDAPPLVDVLVNLFPRNIFESMSSGDMLPVIIFSILLGLGMTMAGEPGKRMLSFFQDLDAIIMKVVGIVMSLAPYGVFALIARTFATEGFGAFLPLLKFLLLVLAVLTTHAFLVYPSLLKLLSGLSPRTLLRKIRDVQLFAFSTASSNATIPLSLEVLERKLGVKNAVASFTVPLGATINMDGTAIMQGVATIFIAQVYGIDLDTSQLLMVVLIATLASIGTAGVPGVGLIMLSMVLTQVGLPVAGIGLIIGVDRILDMARTAVNVTGDCVVTCIVANSEKQLDTEVYEQSGDTRPV
ncbi:MAG: dicarboxylate/amino acid:cation symporter [Gammaproteobacteria bacterium]|nr:dicarboxylate/amino acid:cation symporter [Gammaproteobacteria bacterium]